MRSACLIPLIEWLCIPCLLGSPDKADLLSALSLQWVLKFIDHSMVLADIGSWQPVVGKTGAAYRALPLP